MLIGALLGQALERGRALERGLDARNWQGELRVLDETASATVQWVAFILLVDIVIIGCSIVP
jgi:hypothetical protein